MTPSRWTAACILVGAMTLGCRDATGPADGVVELALQQTRWSAQSVSDYVFMARYNCFCAYGGNDVRVDVRGGAVVSRSLAETGAPVPDTEAQLFPAIDGFFDKLRDALARPAAEVRVAYDPVYHFPRSVFIDYVRDAADDEFGFEIHGFAEQRQATQDR
jgi:hypothetical protein